MLLTIKEVAEQLQVSEDRVRDWTKRGELAAVVVSPRASSKKPQLRIRPEALEDFLDERSAYMSSSRKRSQSSRVDKEWSRRAAALGLKIG
ncbi:MAG: helix-turn-helix domain-containing protein [Planctomycetia bacterium]|nr:helix-turn-helix domain-containing protein [Planctomycetia bacterium]